MQKQYNDELIKSESNKFWGQSNYEYNDNAGWNKAVAMSEQAYSRIILNFTIRTIFRWTRWRLRKTMSLHWQQNVIPALQEPSTCQT